VVGKVVILLNQPVAKVSDFFGVLPVKFTIHTDKEDGKARWMFVVFCLKKK
jgi:hypothetical protein